MRLFPVLTAFFVGLSALTAQEADYATARKKAVAHQQPLLIFVDCTPRLVAGFVSVRVDTLAGYPAKCIVLGDKKLDWLHTFAPSAVDTDFRKVVMPTQSPFDLPSSSAGPDVKRFASVDALEEVNAARAQRGLRPFIRDDGLTVGAMAVASYRATHGIRGHVQRPSSDFAFLPPGVDCNAAGCGALDPSWGWGSCCTYERWTHAGAAYAWGADGRRYMHLFVR